MTSITESFAAAEAARANRVRDPWLKPRVAVPMVILSVLIMAYSWLFSIWPILVFYGMWFGVVAWKGLYILRPTRDLLAVNSFATVCLISTLWSDYPAKSAYLGTAFVGLVLSIVIVQRTIPFRSLLVGLTLGIAISMLITLLNGRHAMDHLTGTYALVGLFQSKNMVGFISQVGAMAAITLFFTTQGLLKKLLLGIAPLVVCLLCLYLSRSGTALLTLIISLAAMALAVIAGKIPNSIRGLFWGASLLAVVASIALILAIDGQDAIIKGLGKDSTLTGRTDLWDAGIKIGKERPILGHGYQGFWMQGNPLAEELWSQFFIEGRAGFHFHSVYVQSFVDVGLVGMLVMFSLVFANLLASILALIRRGVDGELVLLLGISLMFAIRSWVEVDFFVSPFGVGSFMFYAILPRLTTHRQRLLGQ